MLVIMCLIAFAISASWLRRVNAVGLSVTTA